jgi:hypothetical protein
MALIHPIQKQIPKNVTGSHVELSQRACCRARHLKLSPIARPEVLVLKPARYGRIGKEQKIKIIDETAGRFCRHRQAAMRALQPPRTHHLRKDHLRFVILTARVKVGPSIPPLA